MNIGQRISDFWIKFTTVPEITVAVCVSLLVFTVLYFNLISFLFKNNAHSVVAFFVACMIIFAGITSCIQTMDNAIFLLVPSVFIVGIMIVYSTEIRRFVWARHKIKLADMRHGENVSRDEEEVKNCIDEIIKALQNMSKNDVGAIIVLSTGNVPSQILDSGVKMDSSVSSQLIESVFFPKTPLHDGAMIINDTRIVAAGCFLPLSQNTNIPKDLGTRHRAGLGVSESVDVISLIVSEETGIISIAVAGKITRYANTETLRKVLNRYYWQDLENVRR